MTEADKSNAKRAMHDNIELIKTTVKHAQHIQDKIAKKTKALKKACKQCETDIHIIKTAGKKAFENNCYEPKDVVEKYWPYPGEVKNLS